MHLLISPPVCTENQDSDVVVMKPAKDWLRFDASSALNRTGDWRIFEDRGWIVRFWGECVAKLF
jgi:hypothetical protein